MIRFGLIAASIVLAGCQSPYMAQRYVPDPSSTIPIRSAGGGPVRLAAFVDGTDGAADTSCRGAEVRMPGDSPIADYFKDAVRSEMELAGALSDQSTVAISGKLLSVSLQSGLANGAWQMSGSLTSSNGKWVASRVDRPFPSSFFGISACNAATAAFLPTVQELVRKLVTHGDLPALLVSP